MQLESKTQDRVYRIILRVKRQTEVLADETLSHASIWYIFLIKTYENWSAERHILLKVWQWL